MDYLTEKIEKLEKTVFNMEMQRDELDRQIDSINGALFVLREAKDKGMFSTYTTQKGE